MNWERIATNSYNDLLAFFTQNAAVARNNIVSLALTHINESTAAAAVVAPDSYATMINRSGGGGGGGDGADGDDNNLSLSNGTAAATLLLLLGNFSLSATSTNATVVGGHTGAGDVTTLTSYGGSGSSATSTTNSTTTITTSKPRISAEIPIWLIPCYSIILLFAVLGNLLVISTLARNRRMRTITNLFLLNLAISDILLGVLCMPVTLTGTLLRHFIFGEFLCKLIPFLQAISVAVSSWTLVAISCERYYAICHPLRSRRWQTINHAYKIIAFIWLGSVVCMAPIALFSQLIPTSRQGLRKCREDWPSVAYERSYNIFLDLVLLVLPLIILCVAYILITRTLYIGMRNERVVIFANANTTLPQQKQSSIATTTTTISNNSNSNSICYANKMLKTNNGESNTAMMDDASVAATTITGLNFNNTSGGTTITNDLSVCALKRTRSEQRQQQKRHHQHKQQQQEQQQHGQTASDGQKTAINDMAGGQAEQQEQLQRRPQCFDESVSGNAGAGAAGAGKWKTLLKDSYGQKHLYHARSASMKSLNGAGVGAAAAAGGPSPSPSMTLMSMAQQQQQQQQQQQTNKQQLKLKLQTPRARRGDIAAERRKSNSTPSLRISDAALLRRSNEAKNLESKKRVVKMMFVLVLEFFICWSPLYIVNTVSLYLGLTLYEYVDYTFISFCHLLAYSSSCCNPITYCFMNASFRRSFLDTFRGLQLQSDNLRGKAGMGPLAATGAGSGAAGAATTASLSMAGNSINMANSVTVMSGNTTMLDSPRL